MTPDHFGIWLALGPLPDAWDRLRRLQGRIWTRNAPPVTQRCPEWRVAA